MITRYNRSCVVRTACEILTIILVAATGCSTNSSTIDSRTAGKTYGAGRMYSVGRQSGTPRQIGIERAANIAAEPTDEFGNSVDAQTSPNLLVSHAPDQDEQKQGDPDFNGPVYDDPLGGAPAKWESVVERPIVELPAFQQLVVGQPDLEEVTKPLTSDERPNNNLAEPRDVDSVDVDSVDVDLVDVDSVDVGDSLDADELALVEELFPVDLPTALQLAGANSLQVALAAERLSAALTRVEQADARWLPSVRVGFSYNRHNGRIQATDGNISEVSRGSFFAGGGLGSGTAPLNGGAGGPPRFAVDLSVAEIVFEPLAARQVVEVVAAEQNATFNQTLLESAVAYLRLVTAQAQLNSLGEIRADVRQMVDLAEAYAAAGEGKVADVQRAKAELARWEHAEFGRQEEVRMASIELARILRLEPGTLLTATDDRLLSWSFFGDEPIDHLIAQAVAGRPEMSRASAQTRAASADIAREHWRPYLPHLMLGFSGGAFGGDKGSQWKNVSDRTDVDVAAIWELENFGWGNIARRELASNRHRQARIEADITRDQIVAQVVAANQRCRIRRSAIRAAETRLDAATKSMTAALLGIREGVQLPLEAQQSVSAVADARLALLDAIASYNLAQLQQLHAVGTPASESAVVRSTK